MTIFTQFSLYKKVLIQQNMSFVIQLDDQFQKDNNSKFGLREFKELVQSTGIFDSIFFEEALFNRFQSCKMLDLFKNYQVLLKIHHQDCTFKFNAILVKDNSTKIMEEKKQKLIFSRFNPKYRSKNQLIIIVSDKGQIITKRIFNFYRLREKDSTKKQREALTWINRALLQFIQQSVQYFKSIIIKLELNVVQINRIKVKYWQNKVKALNLCNYSYQPTFQMYRRNPVQCKFYNDFNSHQYQDKHSHNQYKQSCLYSQDNVKLVIQEKRSCASTRIGLEFNLKQIYSELHNCQDKIYKKELQDKSQNQQSNAIDMYRKTFISNLQINFNKKDANRKDQVYDQIQIKNVEKMIWQNFQFTLLSNLKIGKVKYLNKTLFKKQVEYHNSGSLRNQVQVEPEIHSATMILKYESLKSTQKHEVNKNRSQINWQKTIIQECFKGQSCGYLPKYFFTDQNVSSSWLRGSNLQCIMSEYMKRGTLRSWLSDSGQLNSLCTKINVILYILYGLTFIHSKKTIHLDLKPMNILMEKNLLPKITDFGSAYNKDVYQKMKKLKNQYFLSFSIPYTAPEIFMKAKKPLLNQKCDIFSIGLIIYQVLFNQSFFNRQVHKNVEQMYSNIGRILENEEIQRQTSKSQDNSQRFNFKKTEHLLKNIYFCPQGFQNQKSQIYSLYLNLIFRCLSCYQERRPFLGSLIIAIKQAYQSFLQYYSW